jgi:serine/threonine protein kinase
LLHIPRLTPKELENETAAIRKICGQKRHTHIVAVLRIGELENTSYYFIDMELCDLTLHDYIHPTKPPDPAASLPIFIKDKPPPIKAQQIWNVMQQITSGLAYIHSLNLAHRDLKPANSKTLHAFG